MADFNPDTFLQETGGPATATATPDSSFDPDKFLSETGGLPVHHQNFIQGLSPLLQGAKNVVKSIVGAAATSAPAYARQDVNPQQAVQAGKESFVNQAFEHPIQTAKGLGLGVASTAVNYGPQYTSGGGMEKLGTPEQTTQASEMVEQQAKTPQEQRAFGVGQLLAPMPAGGEGLKAGERVLEDVARGAAQRGAEKTGEKIDKAITKGIDKGIKPTVVGKKTLARRNQFYSDANDAVKSIADNRDNINIVDENGEKAPHPRSSAEMAQAIDQTKKIIYKQYHDMAVAAGDKGAQFDAAPIIAKIEEVSKDLKESPETRKYAESLKSEISELNGQSPEVIEARIKDMNSSLAGFYSGRTEKAKARVDASVANLMREELDNKISGAVGPGYQDIKKKYGSLKAIEREVNHRAIVNARKAGKSVIDMTDIFTGGDLTAGVLTMNPMLIAKGVAGRGLKEIYKAINNPDRAVSSMFKKVYGLSDKQKVIAGIKKGAKASEPAVVPPQAPPQGQMQTAFTPGQEPATPATKPSMVRKFLGEEGHTSLGGAAAPVEPPPTVPKGTPGSRMTPEQQTHVDKLRNEWAVKAKAVKDQKNLTPVERHQQNVQNTIDFLKNGGYTYDERSNTYAFNPNPADVEQHWSSLGRERSGSEPGAQEFYDYLQGGRKSSTVPRESPTIPPGEGEAGQAGEITAPAPVNPPEGPKLSSAPSFSTKSSIEDWHDDPAINRAALARELRKKLETQVRKQPGGNDQWNFITGKITRDSQNNLLTKSPKTQALLEAIVDYYQKEGQEIVDGQLGGGTLFNHPDDVAYFIGNAPSAKELRDMKKAPIEESGEEQRAYDEEQAAKDIVGPGSPRRGARGSVADVVKGMKGEGGAVAFKDDIDPSKYKSLNDFKKDYEVLYHGGSKNIIGGKLSTGSRVVGEVTEKNLGHGQDYGGIFFTPEKQLAETFKGHAPGGEGAVHNFLVRKKDIFDPESKVLDRMKLKNFIGKEYTNSDGEKTEFTKQMYNFIFPLLDDGKRHMDWATMDPDILQAMGYKGAKVIENYGGDGEKPLISTVLFKGGVDSPHWLVNSDKIEDVYKQLKKKSKPNRSHQEQADIEEGRSSGEAGSVRVGRAAKDIVGPGSPLGIISRSGTGAVAGGTAGYSTGKTPAERRRNAVIGAIAGGVGGVSPELIAALKRGGGKGLEDVVKAMKGESGAVDVGGREAEPLYSNAKKAEPGKKEVSESTFKRLRREGEAIVSRAQDRLGDDDLLTSWKSKLTPKEKSRWEEINRIIKSIPVDFDDADVPAHLKQRFQEDLFDNIKKQNGFKKWAEIPETKRKGIEAITKTVQEGYDQNEIENIAKGEKRPEDSEIENLNTPKTAIAYSPQIRGEALPEKYNFGLANWFVLDRKMAPDNVPYVIKYEKPLDTSYKLPIDVVESLVEKLPRYSDWKKYKGKKDRLKGVFDSYYDAILGNKKESIESIEARSGDQEEIEARSKLNDQLAEARGSTNPNMLFLMAMADEMGDGTVIKILKESGFDSVLLNGKNRNYIMPIEDIYGNYNVANLYGDWRDGVPKVNERNIKYNDEVQEKKYNNPRNESVVGKISHTNQDVGHVQEHEHENSGYPYTNYTVYFKDGTFVENAGEFWGKKPEGHDPIKDAIRPGAWVKKPIENDIGVDYRYKKDPNKYSKYIEANKVDKKIIKSSSGKPGLIEDVYKQLKKKSKPAEPLYSNAQKAVNDINMPKAPASQWLSMLDPAKGKGTKADEMKWIGLDDFLKDKGNATVTKQEIQEFIDQNKVQLKEVRKQGRLESKFSHYQLPGGSNHREVLLTLPIEKTPQTYQEWKTTKTGEGSFDLFANENKDYEPDLSKEAYEKEKLMLNKREPYESSHWDEPNVLAHYRLNDRTDADGNKVLFVEEIQSDWHQEGRKKGYKIDPQREKELRSTIAEMESKGKSATPEEKKKWVDAMNELQPETNESKVPSAPFSKTWHELAFKRILREAAEKGYDKVAWTTGEQQAARYDLSKQVDAVRAKKSGDNYLIFAVKNGEETGMGRHTAQELPNVVGKDLAQKIVDDGGGTYSGLDLKVGDEGMKGFYDKILVDYANKYGKKWGAKVEDDNIGDGLIAHSMTITPAVKKSVMEEGQPMFAAAAGAGVAGTIAASHKKRKSGVSDVVSRMKSKLKE